MEIYDGNECNFDSDSHIDDIPVHAGGKAASSLSPEFGQGTRPISERPIAEPIGGKSPSLCIILGYDINCHFRPYHAVSIPLKAVYRK